MNNFEPKQILDEVFKRVRQDFQLGMSEYLTALKALEGGWGNQEEDLQETLKLLWCHSPSQQEQFLGLWNAVKISLEKTKPQPENESRQNLTPETSTDLPSQPDIPKPNIITPQNQPVELQTQYHFATVPTRASFIATDTETPSALSTDFPLTRRRMSYHWQYLNRPVKDGSEDVLDVDETVERTARQGFFSISYLYPSRNKSCSSVTVNRSQWLYGSLSLPDARIGGDG